MKLSKKNTEGVLLSLEKSKGTLVQTKALENIIVEHYLIWNVSFSNIGIILRNISLKALITSKYKYEKETLIEKWTRE